MIRWAVRVVIKDIPDAGELWLAEESVAAQSAAFVRKLENALMYDDEGEVETLCIGMAQACPNQAFIPVKLYTA